MMLFIDFWTRLFQTNLIIGLILAIIGLGMILLSKKITQKKRGTTEVSNKDSLLVGIRVFGLVFILVAMFVMILY